MSSSSVATPPTDGLVSRNKVSSKQDQPTKEHSTALDFAHSFPIHTKAAPSILSKDSTEGLSFRGFGNLARESPPSISSSILILVLVMVFGNLRLMVENYVKVLLSRNHYETLHSYSGDLNGAESSMDFCYRCHYRVCPRRISELASYSSQ
jgi:hypothetical protein